MFRNFRRTFFPPKEDSGEEAPILYTSSEIGESIPVKNKVWGILDVNAGIAAFRSFLLEWRFQDCGEWKDYLASWAPITEEGFKQRAVECVGVSIGEMLKDCILKEGIKSKRWDYSIWEKITHICSDRFMRSKVRTGWVVDTKKLDVRLTEIRSIFIDILYLIAENFLVNWEIENTATITDYLRKDQEKRAKEDYLPRLVQETIELVYWFLENSLVTEIIGTEEVQDMLSLWIMTENMLTQVAQRWWLFLDVSTSEKVVDACHFIATQKIDHDKMIREIRKITIENLIWVPISDEDFIRIDNSCFGERVLTMKYRRKEEKKWKSKKEDIPTLIPYDLEKRIDFQRLLTRLFIQSSFFRKVFSRDSWWAIILILMAQWKNWVFSDNRIAQIESFFSRIEEQSYTHSDFICHVLFLEIEDIPHVLDIWEDERSFISNTFMWSHEEGWKKRIVISHDTAFLRHITPASLRILSKIQTPELIDRLVQHPQNADDIIIIEEKAQLVPYIHSSYPWRKEMQRAIDKWQANPTNPANEAGEVCSIWNRWNFGTVALFHRDTLWVSWDNMGTLNHLYIYFWLLDEDHRRVFLIDYFSLDTEEQRETFWILERLGKQAIFRNIPSLEDLRTYIAENSNEDDDSAVLVLHLEEWFWDSQEDGSNLPSQEECVDEGIDEPSTREKLIIIFWEDIIEIIDHHQLSEDCCIAFLSFEGLEWWNFIDDFLLFMLEPIAESFFESNEDQDITDKIYYISSLLKLFEANHIFSLEKNNKLFEFCFNRGEELDVEIIEEYLSQIHTSTTGHGTYIASVMRFLKTGSILYLKDDSVFTIWAISDTVQHVKQEEQEKVIKQLESFFQWVYTAFNTLGIDQEYSCLIEWLYKWEWESYTHYIERITALDSQNVESMLSWNGAHSFMNFFQIKLNGAWVISCIEYIEIIRDWISEKEEATPLLDFDESYYQLQSQLRRELKDISISEVPARGRKRKRKGTPWKEEMLETSYVSELSPRQYRVLWNISSARSNNINSIVNSVLRTARPDHRMIYYKLIYSALKTWHKWEKTQIEKLSRNLTQSEWNVSTKAIANATYWLQCFISTEVPKSLIHTITGDIKKQYKNFSDQHLRNTLMWLSDFSKDSEVRSTSSKLFKEITDRWVTKLNDLDIRYIVVTFHLHNREEEIPTDFLSRYEKIKNLPPKPRRTEEACFRVVRERYKNTKNWVHIDGYELDILTWWEKLNIEIDGGHHKTQEHYDKKRDLYLKEKHGILTQRYVLCQPTLEQEIISFTVWLDETLREIQSQNPKK